MLQTRISNPYSESDYQAAVQALLQGGGGQLNDLFAMRCQWFREQMGEEHHDLLFIPVGHKPYGPILAALAAPSRRVVLLASAETRGQAEVVRESLAEDFSMEIHVIVPTDGLQVADKVQAIYEAAGCPGRVVCDQTGGQKPTTSTLAGLAALNSWQLLYIDSKHDKNLVHSEVALWLPNLFDNFGGLHRWVAEVCVAQGHWRGAESEYRKALETAALTSDLRRKLDWVRAARAFREADFRVFEKALGKRRREFRAALAACGEVPQAFLYWAIRLRLEDGDRLAASALSQSHFQESDARACLSRLRQQWGPTLRRVRPLYLEFARGRSSDG